MWYVRSGTTSVDTMQTPPHPHLAFKLHKKTPKPQNPMRDINAINERYIKDIYIKIIINKLINEHELLK